MSNGVNVIIAGTTPAYRWENANAQPTLTLSEAVVMLLPHNKPNEFVTKTCTTTFTYLNTITRDGMTIISTDQQVVSNTATEQRHRTPIAESASLTLKASPTLRTEVFQTTYTYLTLNPEHPSEVDPQSSIKVITNTVTAPHFYIDMLLESSEAQQVESTSYPSTKNLESTNALDSMTKANLTSNLVIQATEDIESITTIPSRSVLHQITDNLDAESINSSLYDDLPKVSSSSSYENHATETLYNNSNNAQQENENNSDQMQLDSTETESNDVNFQLNNAEDSQPEDNDTEGSVNVSENKKPLQVSNLLNLGSLGINSLSALGPMITAMAGLLQGKKSAARRNDSESVTEAMHTTTQRSPIYIPVAEFVDGDSETAESQSIVHTANSHHIPETRHKLTSSSLVDGIPISPGEVITTNSDIIIGRPGIMGPRPPQNVNSGHTANIANISPPSTPYSNLQLHSVLEVSEDVTKKKLKPHRVAEQLEILPAQQVYEEHISLPNVKPHGEYSENPNKYSLYKKNSLSDEILENDPLLLPPAIKYNKNVNNDAKKSNRPWNYQNSMGVSMKNEEIRPTISRVEKVIGVSNYTIDNSYNNAAKLHGSEPIVHQVPHVIDRATGQPLLVNIQPSQIANVIIPPKGTQALIFGDTNEPHISGQYFDDPSPYPDSEDGTNYSLIKDSGKVNPPAKHHLNQEASISREPIGHASIGVGSFSGQRKDTYNTADQQDHYHQTAQDQVVVKYPESLSKPSQVANDNFDYYSTRKDQTKLHLILPPTPHRRNEVKKVKYSLPRWTRPAMSGHQYPHKMTVRPLYRPSRLPILNKQTAPATHYSNRGPKINQTISYNTPHLNDNYHLSSAINSHQVHMAEGNSYQQNNQNYMQHDHHNLLDREGHVHSGPHDYKQFSLRISNDINTSNLQQANRPLDSETDASDNRVITTSPHRNNIIKPFIMKPNADLSKLGDIHVGTGNVRLSDPKIPSEKEKYNSNFGIVSRVNNTAKKTYAQAPIDMKPPDINPEVKYNSLNTRKNNLLSNYTSVLSNQNTQQGHQVQHIPLSSDHRDQVVNTNWNKHDGPKRPNIQFSLPIDSNSHEKESHSQTESPPIGIMDSKVQKNKSELLSTAYQTNFMQPNKDTSQLNSETKKSTPKLQYVSQFVSPPKPPEPTINLQMTHDLKPPTTLTEVLGLTPPPIDKLTTSATLNKTQALRKYTDVSGMRPPPPQRPSPKETKTIPLPPDTNMVPPTSSTVKNYNTKAPMNNPIITVKPTRTQEISSVHPNFAMSGSIQIATAVAKSQIPVIQDMESKIPIVHGTVDLPRIMNVPPFLKPETTRKSSYVSVYSVRPFETRRRIPLKTYSNKVVTNSGPTKIIENATNTVTIAKAPSKILRKPNNKPPDFTTYLEPSADIYLPHSTVEPTETLNSHRSSNNHNTSTSTIAVTSSPSSSTTSNVQTNDIVKSEEKAPTILSAAKPKSSIRKSLVTTTHDVVMAPKDEDTLIGTEEVTHVEVTTITRTRTAIVSSKVNTRTLLLTHTLTSTSVETVTETYLRPTSVVSKTITSTVLHSVIDRVPNYERDHDHESIFVVMSDQNPPPLGGDEVEAEYGEEEISRDEQDTMGTEIHRVLAGGVLGIPSVSIRPPNIQCATECRSSKFEICAEFEGEMRCVCRPGFGRMFPDRPCKPTYTFTLTIALDKVGKDGSLYDARVNDTTSLSSKRFTGMVKEALDRTMMQSDLRDIYRSLSISRVLTNPMRVSFNVQFSSNTNESTLVDVIRKYLIINKYSLGGTDVIAAKDLSMIEAIDFDECQAPNGLHHDCSQNSACFNLKGTYQCSCKEGFADLSENSAFPGRICSQAPLGCTACNNKGMCVKNNYGHEVCECFAWYSGQKCQINLKVLLIVLITTGVTLLSFLAICVGVTCVRNSNASSNDRRAIIKNAGGGCDTNSEGSVTELAIPHHLPHILPPPPQMLAPAPPVQMQPNKRMAGEVYRTSRRSISIAPPGTKYHGLRNTPCATKNQRNKPFPVIIPRAKYRSVMQPMATAANYKFMSTFSAEEKKLMDHLESSISQKPNPPKDTRKDFDAIAKSYDNFPSSGALISAGFQVSATVSRPMDADSTATRSCDEMTEPLAKNTHRLDLESTIKPSTKQMMQFDNIESGSTLARSCGETTVQPSTKLADHKCCNKDGRDSASEGHTMAERDVGSTLRLPVQHLPLYNQDRGSIGRESNFDSL
ncbi:hypothetical protein TKK_0004215 [Trichogramma kaykai]